MRGVVILALNPGLALKDSRTQELTIACPDSQMQISLYVFVFLPTWKL